MAHCAETHERAAEGLGFLRLTRTGTLKAGMQTGFCIRGQSPTLPFPPCTLDAVLSE